MKFEKNSIKIATTQAVSADLFLLLAICIKPILFVFVTHLISSLDAELTLYKLEKKRCINVGEKLFSGNYFKKLKNFSTFC